MHDEDGEFFDLLNRLVSLNVGLEDSARRLYYQSSTYTHDQVKDLFIRTHDVAQLVRMLGAYMAEYNKAAAERDHKRLIKIRQHTLRNIQGFDDKHIQRQIDMFRRDNPNF